MTIYYRYYSCNLLAKSVWPKTYYQRQRFISSPIRRRNREPGNPAGKRDCPLASGYLPQWQENVRTLTFGRLFSGDAAVVRWCAALSKQRQDVSKHRICRECAQCALYFNANVACKLRR